MLDSFHIILKNLAIMPFLMLLNLAIYPCPYYALESFMNIIREHNMEKEEYLHVLRSLR